MAKIHQPSGDPAGAEEDLDPAALGPGTYFVPEVGIVLNGTVLDDNDPVALATFYAVTPTEQDPPAPPPDEPVDDPAPTDPDSGQNG